MRERGFGEGRKSRAGRAGEKGREKRGRGARAPRLTGTGRGRETQPGATKGERRNEWRESTDLPLILFSVSRRNVEGRLFRSTKQVKKEHKAR